MRKVSCKKIQGAVLIKFLGTYQIQHLIVTKHCGDEVRNVVTNEYKKDAIAKIIRLLTVALAGTLDRHEMNVWAAKSSLASPWYENSSVFTCAFIKCLNQ